jgi:opacity protein-like surface antigen
MNYKNFNTLFGARGAYHFTIIDKWEVYGGAFLRIKLESERFSAGTESTAAHTHVSYGWQVIAGTRYMFTPSLGAFVELGYGATYGSIGPLIVFSSKSYSRKASVRRFLLFYPVQQSLCFFTSD